MIWQDKISSITAEEQALKNATQYLDQTDGKALDALLEGVVAFIGTYKPYDRVVFDYSLATPAPNIYAINVTKTLEAFLESARGIESGEFLGAVARDNRVYGESIGYTTKNMLEGSELLIDFIENVLDGRGVDGEGRFDIYTDGSNLIHSVEIPKQDREALKKSLSTIAAAAKNIKNNREIV